MMSMSDEEQAIRAEETAAKGRLYSDLRCTVEYFRSVTGWNATERDERHDEFKVRRGRASFLYF